MSTPAGDWFTGNVEPRRHRSRFPVSTAAAGKEYRLMTIQAAGRTRSTLGRVLRAPFTRRTWADLGYTVISFPLAIAGFLFTIVPFSHPVLLFVSTPATRGLATANRNLADRYLGERIPEPPPLRPRPHVHVKSPAAGRLATLISAAGGTVRLHRGDRLRVTGMPVHQIAELAATEHIAVEELKPHNGWLEAAARDKPAWRARGYLVLKLPLSLLALLPWAGAVALLTVSIWWGATQPTAAPPVVPQVNVVAMILLTLAGAGALLAAPWLTNAVLAVDRSLMRALLGPTSLAERVRDLEATRAHAVDDAAARLRSIERDLHDGAQAQLVGLAMKLGLAKEKLDAGARAGVNPADLDRAAELVDAAHRNAIEAITELRVLARGIHPPVLDNGLADALATLAARSAVPIDLVTDIGERPSAAIETIAYFCAAELLANVAKHSGARHATLEAVHVPGLLRLRVADDGRGGARPESGGGLRGLADRIRTVDGVMEISSPRGGPTVVTVELPSHA
jgi:signal transduction histidine kinase